MPVMMTLTVQWNLYNGAKGPTAGEIIFIEMVDHSYLGGIGNPKWENG